jgi:hypothetical protein
MKTLYAQAADLIIDAKKANKVIEFNDVSALVYGEQLGDCEYYKLTKKGWVQL